MTGKEFKNKVASVDKRIWVAIACGALCFLMMWFFLVSEPGRVFVAVASAILVLYGSMWFCYMVYKYFVEKMGFTCKSLKEIFTDFGKNKKSNTEVANNEANEARSEGNVACAEPETVMESVKTTSDNTNGEANTTN